jgi:Cys-tRNA(Pro) deacylase
MGYYAEDSISRTALGKDNIPTTPAVRFLREKNIPFQPHFFRYQDHGGTRVGAAGIGVPEHEVIKTLVMETDEHKPVLVLMHGDFEVSTRQLARLLDAKSVTPCDERRAHRLTGYVFGGTSPFGTRTPLPIFIQKSVFSLSVIYVNGGKRGFAVEIAPEALRALPGITEAELAVPA